MQTMARQTGPLQTIRLAPVTTPAPLVRRPIPRTAWTLVIGALVWLYRALFVQPIGRRARQERLGGLSDRHLRDIGLTRADLHAATWGGVSLHDVVRDYPSAGPLFVCGRSDFTLTLVRLSKAA